MESINTYNLLSTYNNLFNAQFNVDLHSARVAISGINDIHNTTLQSIEFILSFYELKDVIQLQKRNQATFS